MDKPQRLSKTSLYFTFFTRIKAASIITLLFTYISKNNDETLLHFVLSSKFYVTIVFGMGLSVIVTQCLVYCNLFFDRICHWRNWPKRLFLVATLGVVPLVLLDRTMFKFVVEKIADQDFKTTNFDGLILPKITLLIIAAHGFLYWRQWCLYSKKEKQKPLETESPVLPDEAETAGLTRLPAELPENPVPVNDAGVAPVRDEEEKGSSDGAKTNPYWVIMECYLGRKKCHIQLDDICYLQSGEAWLKDGRNFSTACNRNVLRKNLNPAHFAEAYGGRFFALNTIASIEEGVKHKIIVLKEGCRNDMPLEISRRHLEDFNQAFLAYLVDKQKNVDKNTSPEFNS